MLQGKREFLRSAVRSLREVGADHRAVRPRQDIRASTLRIARTQQSNGNREGLAALFGRNPVINLRQDFGRV